MRNPIKEFPRNEDGVTSIEYGLIVALITLVALLAYVAIGETLTRTFFKIGNDIKGAADSGSASGSASGSGSTSGT